MRLRHPSLLTVAFLAGCGSSSPPAGTDAGGETDAGGTVDAGGGVDAPVAVVTHECEEADFVDLTGGTPDDRMIMVPLGTTTFDNPCITIRAGQSVMFMWNFSVHPLQPGVAPGHPGSSDTPTPIEARSTGSLYQPTFPDAGDYAYYCANDFHAGMYGVVRVVP